jgi:hypothetical protein
MYAVGSLGSCAVGKTKGSYRAEFEIGAEVRVLDLEALTLFRASWRYHHPLQESQLQYAGGRFKVKSVGFYHGGDELYELEGALGFWHECCLVSSESRNDG